jgi:hypothetical protein
MLDGKWFYINRATPVPHTGSDPGIMIAPMTVAGGEGALLIEEMKPIVKPEQPGRLVA